MTYKKGGRVNNCTHKGSKSKIKVTNRNGKTAQPALAADLAFSLESSQVCSSENRYIMGT
jgi:hypothetical protein